MTGIPGGHWVLFICCELGRGYRVVAFKVAGHLTFLAGFVGNLYVNRSESDI